MVDRLIGGHDRVLEELSNVMLFSLETGGVLDIDAPEDVRIDCPDAEYVDSETKSFCCVE